MCPARLLLLLLLIVVDRSSLCDGDIDPEKLRRFAAAFLLAG